MTQLLNELNWGVRMVSETEVRMNAVERLMEYGHLPCEKASTFNPIFLPRLLP
jgi:hypothetical protein